MGAVMKQIGNVRNTKGTVVKQVGNVKNPRKVTVMKQRMGPHNQLHHAHRGSTYGHQN